MSKHSTGMVRISGVWEVNCWCGWYAQAGTREYAMALREQHERTASTAAAARDGGA